MWVSHCYQRTTPITSVIIREGRIGMAYGARFAVNADRDSLRNNLCCCSANHYVVIELCRQIIYQTPHTVVNAKTKSDILLRRHICGLAQIKPRTDTQLSTRCQVRGSLGFWKLWSLRCSRVVFLVHLNIERVWMSHVGYYYVLYDESRDFARHFIS